MNKEVNLSVINLNQQDIPVIREDVRSRTGYVPVGVEDTDDYFDTLTDAYTTSTTNAACVEGIADLVYGKGLYSKDKTQEDVWYKLFPQEDIKRSIFDLKLYGNTTLQVYWDSSHTKITKIYHTPVQYFRAQKIGNEPKVQNYFYCTDWNDIKQVRNKKLIPAFGTSKEKMEIVWIKGYTPGRFYYSLPDWISALQLSFVEAELSNLHINNISNGFLPMVMINMNNGIPPIQERNQIESSIENKFTGTRNAGRFIISFNDDKEHAPTIDPVQIENLHDKYQYVADYAQDRILVAHRITSPLLFGIRTAKNGFSSQSEEMKTSFSILQTMTIMPFQNLFLNELTKCLEEGGWEGLELAFEQLTPLAILSETAEDTGQSIEEVEEDINEQSENPDMMDEEVVNGFTKAKFYETYK